MNIKRIVLFCILCGVVSTSTFASHLYSVGLSYRCIGNNDYVITAEAYYDCNGITPSYQLDINYSSSNCNISSTAILSIDTFYQVNLCSSAPSNCFFLRYLYSDTINLASCDDWLIDFSSCCRSQSISSLDNSGSTGIYASTTINNTGNLCNNSVTVASYKYIFACDGTTQTHSAGAYDIDDDSLVFSLVSSQSSIGVPVNYSLGYSASNPMGSATSVSMNPSTGDLTFDPALHGHYVIGYEVKEYRAGILIATSYFDVSILVLTCPSSAGINQPPTYSITNIQGGYLQNNIFWVTDSTQLTFDVIASDTNSGQSIVFESTIDAIGGNFSVVGSNPSTASFLWPKTLPTTQEFILSVKDDYAPCAFRGQHRLGFAIKHAVPLTNTCAELDSMTILVAEDSSIQICPTCAGLPVYINSLITPSTTTNGTITLDTVTNCLVYQAGTISQVNEAFWVYIEDNHGFVDSFWLDVTTASCVWAGDTDTNKVVNNFDILPIGLGFGEVGAQRPNADLNYDCEPALDFTNSTPMTNINYKHSDTDGNGVVNADDTTAIVLNWGQVHLKNNHTNASSGIPFYVSYGVGLPGQQMSIPIILGDTSMTADSIYGVAFTINYDESLVDTNTAWVGFGTSWLGTINSDMIAVQKDFYYQGQIDVGVVRTDQTNRNGSGQIGTLYFTIKDDILKSPNQRLDIQISNVRIITNIETERTANTPITDVLISLGTNTIEVGEQEIIKIFPNPTMQYVTVQAATAIQGLKLYNISGQLVKHIEMDQSHYQLDLDDLPWGIYTIQVQTENSLTTQKIQLVR